MAPSAGQKRVLATIVQREHSLPSVEEGVEVLETVVVNRQQSQSRTSPELGRQMMSEMQITTSRSRKKRVPRSIRKKRKKKGKGL